MVFDIDLRKTATASRTQPDETDLSSDRLRLDSIRPFAAEMVWDSVWNCLNHSYVRSDHVEIVRNSDR